MLQRDVRTVDTIVVGAGSAGSVLANRLSADPSRQVVLLEAGHEAPPISDIPTYWIAMLDSEVDWGFHTEPQPGCRMRRIFWPRGKMIGGSGAMNAMIYLRGLPSDYDLWESMGCPGWGWANVLPAFRTSENNLRFGNSPFHGSGGALTVSDPGHIDPVERTWLEAAQAAGHSFNDDFNGAGQEGVGFLQCTISNGERHSSAKGFLRPVLGRPNLSVMTGVTVLRILTKGGRAVGLDYLQNGRLHQIRAEREIVLSAGAIGSPHLLLLSGIGPADELKRLGVDVVHDLPGVGKNLMDHLNLPQSFVSRERVGVGGMTEAEFADAHAEWTASRTGPLTSNWAVAAGCVRSDPSVAEPDLQLYFVASAHRDHARFLAMSAGFTLHCTLQRPRSRGELTLRSADPLAKPVLDPKFLSDPDNADLDTLVKGFKINRAIAATDPLKSVIDHESMPNAAARTDAEIADYIRAHVVTIFHQCGTCRMGTDALAVVDPATMAVRGLDGLKVADASVFPSMVSANINAAVIMVAEQAAARILAAS